MVDIRKSSITVAMEGKVSSIIPKEVEAKGLNKMAMELRKMKAHDPTGHMAQRWQVKHLIHSIFEIGSSSKAAKRPSEQMLHQTGTT